MWFLLMYLCAIVQMNCHPVLFIICCICLGHFASRNSLKSQHLLALRMSFLVIGMGKEEKKNLWESQGKNTFWFFLVKSGIVAFCFSLNQVISRNDFGAQLHKQVSQHDGGQPQAEGRMSGKRGPALTSSGVKNKDEEWCTGERSHTTPYNVEPLNSLKFLFLPLKFNTKH